MSGGEAVPQTPLTPAKAGTGMSGGEAAPQTPLTPAKAGVQSVGFMFQFLAGFRGNERKRGYTTTVSRFAARVTPV